MADITKCVGGACPFKEECYRFTAPQSKMPSMYVGTPYRTVGDDITCEHYWPDKAERQSITRAKRGKE